MKIIKWGTISRDVDGALVFSDFTFDAEGKPASYFDAIDRVAKDLTHLIGVERQRVTEKQPQGFYYHGDCKMFGRPEFKTAGVTQAPTPQPHLHQNIGVREGRTRGPKSQPLHNTSRRSKSVRR